MKGTTTPPIQNETDAATFDLATQILARPGSHIEMFFGLTAEHGRCSHPQGNNFQLTRAQLKALLAEGATAADLALFAASHRGQAGSQIDQAVALEDLGGGLGVTDPVSGDVVVEMRRPGG